MFQDSKPTTDKASKLGQKAIFTDENKEEGADESEELKMSGYRVPLVKNEPLKEYLLRIMESVNDVRVQHEKYHKENDDKTGMLLVKKLKNKTKIYEKKIERQNFEWVTILSSQLFSQLTFKLNTK